MTATTQRDLTWRAWQDYLYRHRDTMVLLAALAVVREARKQWRTR